MIFPSKNSKKKSLKIHRRKNLFHTTVTFTCLNTKKVNIGDKFVAFLNNMYSNINY